MSEDFWTEEDHAHMAQLTQANKSDELLEYVTKRVFEARPRSFGYFKPYADDPLDIEEIQDKTPEEFDRVIREWSERTFVTKWEDLTEDQQYDAKWRVSVLAHQEKDTEQEA